MDSSVPRDRSTGRRLGYGLCNLRLRNSIADREFCVALRIKKTKKNQQTKFKIRAKRFVYTLVLKDASRAEKLTQSMPPSTWMLMFGTGGGLYFETDTQDDRPAKDFHRQEEQEGQGFFLREGREPGTSREVEVEEMA
jgi:ribosomal L38e-like protein